MMRDEMTVVKDLARAQREAFQAGCAFGREVDGTVEWMFEAHARYPARPAWQPRTAKDDLPVEDALLLVPAGLFDE
jgi:hypothetical protein